VKNRPQIFFSIILLLSISWQATAKSYIFIQFKLNQNELAATVCENKDKPKSCCAAKCQLDKEIKKEEKRQSDLPSNIKDKTEKNEFISSSLKLLVILNEFIQEICFHYSKPALSDFTHFIFHPPSLFLI